QLTIEKRAFASISQELVIGLGSNPLGEFQAKPVGSQYVFYVTEFMSGQAVVKAEAVSGEASALSDVEGKVVLAVDTAELEDSATVDIEILADGYRVEKVSLMANNKEAQSVQLVPNRPHVFVSKRSGVYDVYAIDIDGKNERKIVSGSGFERNDIALVSHMSKNKVAYIATRENIRNSNGYLLSTLYLVDVDSQDIVKVDQSERIKIIGWTSSGRLVYVKMTAGGSGPMADRHILMSVNTEDYSEKSIELANSNYFNDVIMVGDTAYYALSNFYNEEDQPGVYAVKVSGGDSKRIVEEEVYSIVRTSYDTLHFSANNQWYEYVAGSPMAGMVNPPSNQDSKLYIDGTNDTFSLWVDNRDGKGVLLSYDKATDHEKQLTALAGLGYPIYWLDSDTVVYRVADSRETADYVISTKGGETRKIVDVTASSGIASWNYY
ncbi:hypothetical protein KC867_01380, partial [Candidatus Saccharibacteria bacterium]|nr:hypothetical protein [Candidatus Saccharibacteria bacterium]